MATIDIGKLTFTHKGDYASGTAYELNDVVYYNGSAYIAKQSTTGNVPTNTTYWSTFTAGSGGIWNRGLSLGSAGQVVKVNSGASALEFGTISSDFVKLAETTITGSSTTAINFDQAISSTYKFYKLYGVYKIAGSNPYLTMRWREGSSSSETTYANSTYRYINDAFHDSAASSRGNGQDSGVSYFQMDNDSGDAKWNNIEIMFNIATAGSAIEYPSWNGTSWQWRDSNTTFFVNTLGGFTDATITPTGFHFYSTNGSNFVADSTFKLFGVK